MPLSIDLRKRVIAAVDAGEYIPAIATRFNVCMKTVYNWINLRNETEKLEPRPDNNRGHSHKITDYEICRKFAEEHQHCTLQEMVAAWHEKYGTTMSISTMSRALQKIGYTFKKKHFITKKQMPKNEKNT